MNEQIKTTAEVAEMLKMSAPHSSDMDWVSTEEILKVYTDSVKSALTESSGNMLESVAEGIFEVARPTLLFNLLGNPPDTNYKFGAVKTDEEVEKSFAILKEEVNELEEAMKNRDNAEILDGGVDIIVVVIGILLKHGLMPYLPAAMALVSHNNLTKLTMGEDGIYKSIIKNGKIQKPEGFKPLDLGEIYPQLKKEVSDVK